MIARKEGKFHPILMISNNMIPYVTVKIVLWLFCTSNYRCTIAKADGLGYSPVNHLALMLWARKCWLILLTTGIAQYMMSNVSSWTSDRWCMRSDNTAYVITRIPFWWPHPINRHIWSAECFFPSKPLSQPYRVLSVSSPWAQSGHFSVSQEINYLFELYLCSP